MELCLEPLLYGNLFRFGSLELFGNFDISCTCLSWVRKNPNFSIQVFLVGFVSNGCVLVERVPTKMVKTVPLNLLIETKLHTHQFLTLSHKDY